MNNFACTETFQCEMCEKIFSTKKDLKCHDKLMHRANVRKLLTGRFNSLKNQVITQKLKISENILSLNMKEHFEIQTCRCKGKCHINHFKHNWAKHRSRDLHTKLQDFERNDEQIKSEARLKIFCRNPWGLSFLTLT